MVYKRGKVWWYKFNWNGETIRESTKQGNKRTAEQIEAARRTEKAKGEVGIKDRGPVPTLRQFEERFISHIESRKQDKPRTVAFYREKYQRLLEHKPLADATLDAIDDNLIEGFIQKQRRKVAPATVNRQLATLRRALRLAAKWKLIGSVPMFEMLSGERIREFVLSPEQEALYLATAPQPLRDVALLIVDTGLRIGEALNLEWVDVHLEPLRGAKFGYLAIRQGKSRYAKRNLSLTPRVREMFLTRVVGTQNKRWAFESRTGKPYVVTSVNHQQQTVREALNLPPDFVIHSLRHTMLTRLGEAGVDAFSIMRIAGHSSVTVSQRYVHPTPKTLEMAFEKLEEFNAVNGVGRGGVGTDLGTVVNSPSAPNPANLLM